MPSALLEGLTSIARNCDRKPTKPIAAPTNTIASAATMVARSQPRGGAATASGFWSDRELISCQVFSCQVFSAKSFHIKSSAFSDEGESAKRWRRYASRPQQPPSVDIVQRGEQRSPRRPRRDRRDQHRLRRQRDIAGGAQ